MMTSWEVAGVSTLLRGESNHCPIASDCIPKGDLAMKLFCLFHTLKALPCTTLLLLSLNALPAAEPHAAAFAQQRETLKADLLKVTYTFRMKEYRELQGENVQAAPGSRIKVPSASLVVDGAPALEDAVVDPEKGMALLEWPGVDYVLYQQGDKYRLEYTQSEGEFTHLVIHNGKDTLIRFYSGENHSRVNESLLDGQEPSLKFFRPEQYLARAERILRNELNMAVESEDMNGRLRLASANHAEGRLNEAIFSRVPRFAMESHLLEQPERIDLYMWSDFQTVGNLYLPGFMRQEVQDMEGNPLRILVFEYDNIRYESVASPDDALFDIAREAIPDSRPLQGLQRAFEAVTRDTAE
jgi:hypothetical protein